jgi:beta-glucosidase
MYSVAAKEERYLDCGLPIEDRVRDLLSRMTLKEKISQLRFDAPAIQRLRIPKYNYLNEGIHGVARAGIATVFPQVIGMAATFNTDLIAQVARAIGHEARAKHHQAVRDGKRGMFRGLTLWCPNVNIFRDPRWGRGQETYGEDPYLTARMAVAFIRGLQGDDPKYLKAAACAKHYAVHSGPERVRHRFNAVVSKKDLRETYLPAFRDCVREARVEAIMCAYNRTNGEPCCANPTLLQTVLREEFGFRGHVVSDCLALWDMKRGHKVVKHLYEAAALALNNGCELNCGIAMRFLGRAVQKGLTTEARIDEALTHIFATRFKLGMFDPPEQCPYGKIPYQVNDCVEHRLLAAEVARESVVLLKNRDNLLPLGEDIRSVAVIGPNADDKVALYGNYHGQFSTYVTPLTGIRRRVGRAVAVHSVRGCTVRGKSRREFARAVEAAKKSDVVVMCLGTSARYEGEENFFPGLGDDRWSLDLYPTQEALLEEIDRTGKPIILILFGGSPFTIEWAEAHVPAIIQAWYPGEEGGTALADILFGDYSPGGRLPVTWIRSLRDIPEFTDYSMKGRTYRYGEKAPLYPFGYGLSYADFSYSDLRLNRSEISAGEDIELSLQVENRGSYDGDEVVQVYVKDLEASATVPHHQLCGFRRLKLKRGEKRSISFTITARQMAVITEDGRCLLEPGRFTVYVGGYQPDLRSLELTGRELLFASFEVTGEARAVRY